MAKPKPQKSTADIAEARTIQKIIAKVQVGKPLTSTEQKTLRKWETQKKLDTFREVAAAIPQNLLIEIFDTSREQMRLWAAAGIPRGTDKGLPYNLFDVGRWLLKWWSKQKEPAQGGEGAIEGGPDTPELQRLRRAKANLAELDLAQRRKELVSVDVVMPALNIATGILRNAAASIERKHGVKAGEVVRKALDNAQARIDDLFGLNKKE